MAFSVLIFDIKYSQNVKELRFKGVIHILHFRKWGAYFQNQIKKIPNQRRILITFDSECRIDPASLYTIAKLIHFRGKTLADKKNKESSAKMPLVTQELSPEEDLSYQGVFLFDDSPQSMEIRKNLKDISLSGDISTEFPRNAKDTLFDVFRSFGVSAFQGLSTMKDLGRFFACFALKIFHIFRRTENFPFLAFTNQLNQVGFNAVPIIALISFLIGMVLAYQGINQLERFGAEIYTIDFLAIGVFREIGVLLTAVVVAGRSSSSFTAQIGTMSLNQEIDAMRVMQLDPTLYLVIPRITALLIALPLLVFLSDIAALTGGMLTMHLVIDLTPLQFLHYLQRAFKPATFWVGMSKAPLFALLIGLVGCFRGMQVRESADSIGRMTTTSVVEAIFLVIICNAFMSLLFSYLKV